jgi:hypothetical protein
MYRKEQILLFAEGYDTSMTPAEDYDLWVRLSMHSAARLTNLPEILCNYRICHKDEKYKERQQHRANLVRKKLLHSIGLTPTSKEFAAHLVLSLWSTTLSLSEIWACKKWIDKLFAAALNAEPAYERKALERELKYRWSWLCENNIVACVFGLVFFCSEFAEFSAKRILTFFKIAVKTIFKKMCGKPACV